MASSDSNILMDMSDFGSSSFNNDEDFVRDMEGPLDGVCNYSC
jgi:hypothetical protein